MESGLRSSEGQCFSINQETYKYKYTNHQKLTVNRTESLTLTDKSTHIPKTTHLQARGNPSTPLKHIKDKKLQALQQRFNNSNSKEIAK